MCNEATLNRIIQTVRELPDASAAEVLDFAEFLQARKADRAVMGGGLDSFKDTHEYNAAGGQKPLPSLAALRATQPMQKTSAGEFVRAMREGERY